MNEPQIDYNQIVVDEGTDVSIAQLEMAIAKNLTQELVKHYPQRNWAVAVDAPNGVCAVMETDISKTKGYVIHLSRPMSVLLGMMKRVGGEILERADVPRGKKFDIELFDELPRDPRGDVDKPDLIAPEDPKVH